MNSKKAKALRKVIKNMTAGSDIKDQGYSEIVSRAKFAYVQADEVENLDEAKVDEPKTKKVKISTGQIVNTQNTARAIYRHLKDELRKEEKNTK